MFSFYVFHVRQISFYGSNFSLNDYLPLRQKYFDSHMHSLKIFFDRNLDDCYMIWIGFVSLRYYSTNHYPLLSLHFLALFHQT